MSLLAFDMTTVIACLSSEEISVKRMSGNTYDNKGRAVLGGVLFKIQNVAVQPRSPEMARSEAGTYVKDGARIWSPVELMERDIIKLSDGRQFQIANVNVWEANGKYWQGEADGLYNFEADLAAYV